MTNPNEIRILQTLRYSYDEGEPDPTFADNLYGIQLGEIQGPFAQEGQDVYYQTINLIPGEGGGGGGGGGSGTVVSVNGQQPNESGAVVVTTGQISESGGKLWFTAAERSSLASIPASLAALSSGKADVSALSGHTSNNSNPHSVTKAQVGLGNVDNTSDANKPISSATQAALDAKAAASALTAHTGANNNPHSVTKSQVGLGNVDNTSDANKPISTATQAALDGKADTSHTQTASTITDFNQRVDDRIQAAGIVTSGGVATFHALAATNINIASCPSSIDNVAMASGKRVMCVGQTDKSQNRGWLCNGVGQAMTAVSDMDTDAKIVESMEVRIAADGLLYGSTRWTLITPRPGAGYVIGVTQLEWTDRLNDLASDLDTFRLSGSFATSPVVEVLKDFRVVDNGYAGFAADPSDETRGILDIPHPMDADVVASGYDNIPDGPAKVGDLFAALDSGLSTALAGGGGGGGGPGPGGDLLLVAVTLGVAVPANTPITLFPEHFPSDHPLWDKIQDDGGDLEAYDDEAKATRLPLHRVKFNYASKILALTTTCPTDKSSGSKLYIQFGNDGTPKTLPASTAAYGSRAVYAGLKAAFVLTGTNPVNFVNDQTASLAGSPVQGSGPNGLPAIGLGATDGGGSSDRIVTPYTDNPSAISCFAVVDGYGPVFSKNKGASGTATNDMFYMNPNNSGRLEYRKQFSSGQKDWYQGGSTSPAPGTFKRVGLRHSGVYTENPNFWVNGTKLTATQPTGSAGTQLTTAHPYVLGNRNNFTAALDGFMSVVYIADVALSDAWFAAVDANHANPSAFATVDEGVDSGGAFATESYVGAQFARIKSAAGITIEDDAAASIAPGHIGGEMKVQVYDPVTDKLLFNFSGTVQYNLDSSPSIAALNDGADFETDTGALTGTTGADAKFTVSAAEGAIYFENRTGATVRVVRTLFGDG